MSRYDSSGVEDEYAKLVHRMNPTRVEIDNEACDTATVVRVYSMNKKGILFEVIRLLTDLDLVITKAYISSDGEWFMNVFNVTHRDGRKVLEQDITGFMSESIETEDCIFPSKRKTVGVKLSQEYTSIELTGTDRPGLLSEICAVLADLKCNVLRAELWTHNTRVAAIVHITDTFTDLPIDDEERLATIKELLSNVMRGNDMSRVGKTSVSKVEIHTGRRLHQLMLDDRDYERVEDIEDDDGSRPDVVLLDCVEKDYTVAILKSKDRPKLLFDVICTLTDMQYVVFHGTVHRSEHDEAYQEYYIRHADGLPVRSEAERQRVVQCLEAAIERRASQGLQLELRTEDRVGLLSEITRVFRENGLTIRSAEISTEGGMAVNTFHVSDMSGGRIDADAISSIQQQIGRNVLRVKESGHQNPEPQPETMGFLFGNLLRACSFQSLRLIRSYSLVTDR